MTRKNDYLGFPRVRQFLLGADWLRKNFKEKGDVKQQFLIFLIVIFTLDFTIFFYIEI